METKQQTYLYWTCYKVSRRIMFYYWHIYENHDKCIWCILHNHHMSKKTGQWRKGHFQTKSYHGCWFYRRTGNNNGYYWDFPGGPGVKNLTCNAKNTGSIPNQRTKIPHAMEQLGPCTTTIKPSCCNCWSLRATRKDTTWWNEDLTCCN